jgi:hypothetical protein
MTTFGGWKTKHTGYRRCANPENPSLVTLGSHMFTKFIERFEYFTTSPGLFFSAIAAWRTAKSPNAYYTTANN